MDITIENASPSADHVWTAVIPLLEQLKAQVILLDCDAKTRAKLAHEQVFEAAVLRTIISLVHEPYDAYKNLQAQPHDAVPFQVHEQMRQCALDLKEQQEHKDAELQVERKRAQISASIIEKLRNGPRHNGTANCHFNDNRVKPDH